MAKKKTQTARKSGSSARQRQSAQQPVTLLLQSLADKFLALSLRRQLLLLALAALAVGGFWLWQSCNHDTADAIVLDTDDRINVTPEQITAIEDIGQWEFLAIADEELVDTTRKGLFNDDHLVRIYYGTLRLGVDMSQAKPGWAQASGDTLVATLPKVGLLDEHFIDEARTKSFYESGKWKGQALEDLYARAYRLMKQHTLTPENLQSAEQNADAQFRQLFKAMGYKHITIRFER